jgi:predicted metal-dependent HD superfamily phosphohydrolase
VTDLAARWPLPSATELRDRLIAAYAHPGRGYHDIRHLAEVLDRLDELVHQPIAAEVDERVVRLAAWFHDAVHQGSPEDEERSAVLAEQSLRDAGLRDPEVAEVARLVRLTRDHTPPDGDLAGGLLCDADLAILASPPERYQEYATDVRTEYLHVTETAFREGRAAVLEALLAKPTLFHTPRAQARWEEAARANVARELTSLRRPSRKR